MSALFLIARERLWEDFFDLALCVFRGADQTGKT